MAGGKAPARKTSPPPEPVAAPALRRVEGIRKVEVIANPLSGSVGPNAIEEVTAILDGYDFEKNVQTCAGGKLTEIIQRAIDAKPDLIIVIAGDGTARAVAEAAGPNGPLVAPLPGGTMNMLPRALYGTADWKVALRRALEEGAPQRVAGGEVTDGRFRQAFYCAAILGAPALWAPAREAVREGKFGLAWAYGRRALKRAFSGRLRFSLDGRADRRAEALVLISPMISKAMDEHTGLEAAAMNPSDALQAFRLAAHAVFDDWRQDPAVTTKAIQQATIRARSRIPAVIDGEPALLRHQAKVRFIRTAFRALAPNPPTSEESV